MSKENGEQSKKDQETQKVLEEKNQQPACMKKEIERKDQEITRTKIELQTTLRVLEKASDREVGNQLRLRQTERIISQKE